MSLRALKFGIVGLVAVAWLTLGGARAWAINRGVSTFPTNGKPTKSGLLLKVDSFWVSSDGYRPVWVTATSTPPTIGDRTLTITLESDAYGRTYEKNTVSVDLELPAGASSATVVVPVPQFANWAQINVTTAEGGQSIDALSGLVTAGVGYRQTVGDTSLLHVTESSVATDPNAFFGNMSQSPGMPQYAGTAVAQEYSIDRALAEMPEEWIDLTALDFVAMSSQELATMVQKTPRVWQAVREWTAAGGNLCIYDVGDQYQRLAEIDGYLGDGMSAPRAESAKVDGSWIDCDRSLLLNLNELITESAMMSDDSDTTDTSNVVSPPAMTPLKEFAARMAASNEVPFRSRGFRLGRVVVMTSSNPLPAVGAPVPTDRGYLWAWVRASLGANRWSWPQRHGLSFAEGNSEFWNLLIAGVGLPPVNAYRVLITLFVILIGPVNYYLLKRLRRLHYLLFIVPASAALVTAALLSYALISDGLGTRLRARSYTLLDQRSGQAVTWARLSYYAGMAPYGGLTFPRDAVIYPFEYESGTDSNNYTQRTTAWDDAQHLARGWLPARTLKQLLVVRSGADRRRLEIAPEGNSLKVTNRLQTKVEQLVIADQSGTLYSLSNLAAGQTVVAAPIPADPVNGVTVPMAFRTALSRRRTGETIVQPSQSSSLLGMNRRYYYPQVRTGLSQGVSLLEQSLRQCDTTTAFSPGSYVALSESGDPALLGVGSAVETGSLYVIEGKW